jgi:uncharacterized protein
MHIITLEERFQLAEIKKAVAKLLPGFGQAFSLTASHPCDAQLEDLGAGRLQRMDAMGIDVQVLSYPSSGIQVIPAAEAVPLAREINDQLAAAIHTHPDRFAGFASLPTPDLEAAAELERAVHTPGFKGAMIAGWTNGRFLDDPACAPHPGSSGGPGCSPLSASGVPAQSGARCLLCWP